MRELVVGIDAGHGAQDRGARGAVLDEAALVLELAVAAAAAARLTMPDVRVELLRSDDEHDPSLAERNATAVAASCKLVLSLHANASERRDQRGALALYYPGNVIGSRIAEAAARAFPLPLYRAMHGGGKHSVAAVRKHWPRALQLLGSFQATAVLLEVGYLDNPEDEATLQRPQVRDGLVLAVLVAINQARLLAR